MNILLTHCWQTGNTGDVAIWKSMIDHLKEAFPVSITICSQKTEAWDVEQLGKVKVAPLLSSKALEEADVVISQGGGYMNGDDMINHFTYFRVAQRLGKPTFFASQTFIGNLSKETRELGKTVLNNANLVVAREEESFKLIQHLGVNGYHLKLLPDGVFTVKAKKYPKLLPPEAVKIGIRGYLAAPGLLKEIAKFADMAVETLGPVVFIPIGHGSRDDRVQANEIAGMMDHKSLVINDRPDAGQLIDILKDGILISNRYHGIVYAASACTPFVPMTPDIDFKMPGLLKMIDYPFNNVLLTETVKAEDIFEYAVSVWKLKEQIRKGLGKTIPGVKARAESVYKLIIKGIKDGIT